MWEASELGAEDLLWAGTNFHGGIAGQQQAPCGVVTAGAVYLGLRHRCSLANEEKAEQARVIAREQAVELVKSFTDKFGSIICHDLLGFDFSDTEAAREFREKGIRKEKCDNYVKFAVEKLYELDER